MGNQATASENSKARKLAHWLDDRFTIPVTNIEFGIDSVISLIPVVGDVSAGLISSYFIVLGIQRGVPKSVLFRMALNILVDVLIGSIPVLGDIFDVIWKANMKNVALLEQYG